MSSVFLSEALTSAELAQILDRRFQSGSGARMEALNRQLEIKRFVLPLFGIQGSGKSTFLNALTLPYPVLPIDADETTCVPVEIAHSPQGNCTAQVQFLDGRSQVIPATVEELRPLVHQAENPGNQKGVDRITIACDDCLLETGLVLVDLPGIGSLTPSNVERTRAYLEEASGVIFLLRTVPPITRSESLGIALAWAKHPAALFVQNRWNDESDAEAQEGMAHNIRVLSSLAEKHHIPVEGLPVIHLVNAYRAYSGKLVGDPLQISASGLTAFRNSLTDVASRWPEWLFEAVLGTLKEWLASAFRQLADERASLTKDRKEIEEQLALDARRFDTYQADLGRRRNVAMDKVDLFRDSERKVVEAWVKTSREDLRNKMRTKMRGGIVDGTRLKEALIHEETEAMEEIYASFLEQAMALMDSIRADFDGAVAWESSKPATPTPINIQPNTKYEQILKPGGGAVGTVGGMWAGAKLGAAIGTSFGPAGTGIGLVIGGIVGSILGGVLGGAAGEKGKDYVTGQRAETAEPVVFDAIERFTRETRNHLFASIRELREAAEKHMDGWLEAQKQQYEKERENCLVISKMNKDQKVAALATLEEDQTTLTAWQDRLARRF